MTFVSAKSGAMETVISATSLNLNKTAKYNTLIVEPKGKYKCKPVIRDMNAKHTIEQLRHRHYITISTTLREGTELRCYYHNHSL